MNKTLYDEYGEVVYDFKKRGIYLPWYICNLLRYGNSVMVNKDYITEKNLKKRFNLDIELSRNDEDILFGRLKTSIHRAEKLLKADIELRETKQSYFSPERRRYVPSRSTKQSGIY